MSPPPPPSPMHSSGGLTIVGGGGGVTIVGPRAFVWGVTIVTQPSRAFDYCCRHLQLHPVVQQRRPRDQVFGVPWPYVLCPLVTIVIPPRGIESGAGGGGGGLTIIGNSKGATFWSTFAFTLAHKSPSLTHSRLRPATKHGVMQQD